MKKFFMVTVALMAVFGFSSGLMAQEICTNCKCPDIGHVYCDVESGQGATNTCNYFDYETRNGYCSDSQLGGLEKCRAIFNICDCPNAATYFKEGETIGVRMTILVDGEPGQNGAYWSQPASANVRFDQFASATAACAASTVSDSFGPGKFFKYPCEDNIEILPAGLTADPDCTVGVASQATVILTDPSEGYDITTDNQDDKESHWWIDIPVMRIDREEIAKGALISVKIELLNQESGGICSECASVCECIIDVAYVCCEDDIALPMPTNFGMYFPYVVDSGSWHTGIVVANIGSMMPWDAADVAAENMEATLILTDENGVKYTYAKTDFTTTNWAFNLGSLLAEFDGTPADGPMWLEVQTNFLVDGYSYIENGVYGLGTQARQWSSLLEIYKQYADILGMPTNFGDTISEDDFPF
jgi:hypothetical protein